MIIAEIAEREAVEVMFMGGVAERTVVRIVWGLYANASAGFHKPVKFLHSADNIGEVLDDVNRAQMVERPVREGVWKAVEIADYIGGARRIDVDPYRTRVLTDPAANVKNSRHSYISLIYLRRVQGLIGGKLAAFLLRDKRMPVETFAPDESQKFQRFFGSEILKDFAGKTVLDFGCGTGNEVIEIARATGPSTSIIGLDMRDNVLDIGRQRATAQGLGERCKFVKTLTEPVDVIFSIDAFEHFPDAQAVIDEMYRMLKPGGKVYISFGPPWYHPSGSHFPGIWWNLLYTERALMTWRAQFKTDGAQRYGEVEGGLNQMTVSKFEALLAKSDFKIEKLRLIPIRVLRRLHFHLTREFTTAVVQAVLVKR